MDNLTKRQRSLNMSRIKSKWTTQEKRVHNYLKGNKIKHKMHPRINGSPDIILKNKKIVIFLHGCFWHKCPKHYLLPKSKREYWSSKIKANVLRDKRNSRLLRSKGYKVIILWEHQLKKELFKRPLEHII